MELTVNGHTVYAATGGRPFNPEAPVVVFLHGAGCDHTSWQLQSRWFAWHGHSVLAVDLPGHGRSQGAALANVEEMTAWVGALLKAARVERASLVGHSMGGAIALEAAAALGSKITRIALIGTAAAIPVSDVLLSAARDAPERAYRMMTAWAHGADAKMGGNPVPGLWMTGGTLAVFARNGAGVLHTDLAACAGWQTGARAAKAIRCPALVVVGAHDVMTPARKGRELAGLIEASRTVAIPDCGHMLMAEAPDAVLDALIEFFAPAHAA
jgi:pimeloyl-ACP methyl ester carboxylesterase